LPRNHTISSDTSITGSFNTTYQIVGEVGSMNVSEDLVTTTMTKDFDSSPEARYVNCTSSTSHHRISSNERNLPNPFATKHVIVRKISSDITTSIVP
jgi:hypothetical protein